MHIDSKFIVNFSLRFFLPFLCIVWVIQDINLENLFLSISSFSTYSMTICGILFLLSFFAEAFRLRFLTDGKVLIGGAFEAHVIGMGINVMLPAKLGEAARIIHLSQKADIPASKISALIFWERFMDLNFLLIFGTIAVHFAQYTFASFFLGILVCLIWVFFIFIRVFPALVKTCLYIIPGERIRLFSNELVMQLRDGMRPNFIFCLCFYGILVWITYAVTVGFTAVWGLGLTLSLPQIAILFIAVAGSLAVPSSPGNVGVFEAAVVAVLASFEWDRTEALGAAIALHLVLLLPQMIGALTIIIAGRFRLKSIFNDAHTGKY